MPHICLRPCRRSYFCSGHCRVCWVCGDRQIPEVQASEHVRQGFSAGMVERLLNTEAQRIEAGGIIPFGTSCLAVFIKD